MKKIAYCTISYFENVYTIQYFKLRTGEVSCRTGCSMDTFKDVPDDTLLLDFSKSTVPNEIFNFIMNNDLPSSVSNFGTNECVSDYLNRFATAVGIQVTTIGELRKSSD